MVLFSNLLVALGDVPDPRRAQGKRYPLPHLLVFTVLALLSGAQSYRGIITFLDQRRVLLNRYFRVDLKRAPVVNTWCSSPWTPRTSNRRSGATPRPCCRREKSR